MEFMAEYKPSLPTQGLEGKSANVVLYAPPKILGP